MQVVAASCEPVFAMTGKEALGRVQLFNTRPLSIFAYQYMVNFRVELRKVHHSIKNRIQFYNKQQVHTI